MLGVAAVGFVVGAAWPKLAGVKLIPEAPRDEFRTPASASAEVVVERRPSASGAAVVEENSPSSETLEVGRVEVQSCVDASGRTGKSCGELDVDALLLPRLLMLEGCPERAGATGVLSLGFELDYRTRTVGKVRSGASTTLPDSVRDGLLACARKNLGSLKLPAETPSHVRYSVFYRIGFRLSGAESAAASPVERASGEVVVRWPSALLRKDADRNAAVVLKVRKGARLQVRGRKGDWLEVATSDQGKSKIGFIHGAAVGEGGG